MRELFTAAFIFLFFPALAQNSTNYIQVTANTGLNFFINDAADLETDQVLNNALTIRLRSLGSNCSVYAKLSSFSAPSGFIPSGNILALDWTSDNSNKDYNLITGPQALTTTDVLLLNQKKMQPSREYFDYYYNLILYAPGYTYVQGNYSFTILFTMTQP